MAKPKLRNKAENLRKKGFSIKQIAKKLGVSSSTVSIWCKSVKLTPELIAELEKRYRDPYYGKRYDNILKQKQKRLKIIETLKIDGINKIGKLNKRDWFILGVALYWAEGFKKDARLGFANSDPAMIKIFLKWLIEICAVPKDAIRLRVGINIEHKYRIEEIQNYWSELTGIPVNNFQKPYFQKFIWKKEYTNKNDYFGVLRIRANKQLPLFRKIHGFIEGLRLNSS